MSESLMKPCPCCGKQESVVIVRSSDDENFDYSNDDCYAIICDASQPDGPGGCGCCGGYRLELDEAIAVWNRRTQPEATKPAQDLVAAILALPLPEPLGELHYHREAGFMGRLEGYSRSQMRDLLKAAAALASPADALVAGDRETTTSDSENCAHLTNCPGCDKCEALLEHYMACDECGSWGNKEANGWKKTSENQFVCESCAAIQAQKDGHG